MNLILIVLVVVMGLTSCNLPKEAPATEVMSTAISQVDEMVETPTVVVTENVYSNEAFGLSFDYPVQIGLVRMNILLIIQFELELAPMW